MKTKFMVLLFAGAMLCACGSNQAKKELLKAIEDATEEMENASDGDECKSINDDLCDEMKKIGKEYGDVIEKIDDKKPIDDAFSKYMDVRREKCPEGHLFMKIPSVN